MSYHDRDWYLDWLRKRTNYVERASFRVSEGVRQDALRRGRWRRVFVRLAVLLCVMVLAIAWRRMRS